MARIVTRIEIRWSMSASFLRSIKHFFLENPKSTNPWFRSLQGLDRRNGLKFPRFGVSPHCDANGQDIHVPAMIPRYDLETQPWHQHQPFKPSCGFREYSEGVRFYWYEPAEVRVGFSIHFQDFSTCCPWCRNESHLLFMERSKAFSFGKRRLIPQITLGTKD